MNRYVCIHGHFYQPPRENPWLEEVEIQDSAYPYHDWNERITSECYAPNTAARILDGQGQIIDIVNNYTKISFNFGPTLLSWLKRNDPVIHEAIVRSDEESRKHFSGHGSALAQCFNHMIMPLATSKDKTTQVRWGLRDFEYRFGRPAEGMWLPETAVDLESLDVMAREGIKFSILAPNQAQAVRSIGEEKWYDVSGARIDPRRPYLCRLPSGRTIALFFYDGPISNDLAFGDLLKNGENLARRLLGAFSPDGRESLLVHISTDGETYGHHHHMGDMALSYCLRHIEEHKLAKITNYGEFLEKHPPTYEVKIFENSSWSCIHGVERWRTDCGCRTGGNGHWHQKWRAPLRKALDWLRDNLALIYENELSGLMKDVWRARDAYIDVILDRSRANIERFFDEQAQRPLTKEEKTAALKMLEMQRHAMLMYTSCGWFFEEISGIETVQILQYAAKAIQLAEEMSGVPLEKMFLHLLMHAPSNLKQHQHGANVYTQYVKPAVLDLLRVGAHYAVSSLFEDYSSKTKIYSYEATSRLYDRIEMGRLKLAVGEVHISSEITWEEKIVSFAVLHLGDHNLVGGVKEFSDEKEFTRMHKEIKDAFSRNDISRAIDLMEKHFGDGRYSLQHLFKDEQSKILYQILDSTLGDVEVSLRRINEHHHPIIQVLKQLHVPLPKVLINTVLVMINSDLLRVLGAERIDFPHLQDLVSEIREWSLEIDRVALEFVVRRRVTRLMEKLDANPRDINVLETTESILRTLEPLALNFDLWKAQNIYFSVGKKLGCSMQQRAQKGDKRALRWTDHFGKIGHHLRIHTP